jgi:hypothetical protein
LHQQSHSDQWRYCWLYQTQHKIFRSGFSVSSAGDVNGDGLDDLIVGAKYADLSDKPNAGKSYVIFGKTDTNAVDLTKLGGNSKYAIGTQINGATVSLTKHNIRFTLGTDSILINANNITALEQTGAGNRARVDGGGGVDTLKLDGEGLTLDLTKISNTRIQDIEIIDIRGSGNNSLKLHKTPCRVVCISNGT